MSTPSLQPVELVVPARFNGPPGSGNGGWVAGALAGLTRPEAEHARPWPAVEVTLTAPPPLEVRLTGHHDPDAGTTELAADGRTVARARPAPADPVPVAPVPLEQARAATAAAQAADRPHPFPGCVVCGPERAEGDGLRILAGEVAPGRVAATWTPHASFGERGRAWLASTWAALDCSGAWASGFGTETMVLGRMSARIDVLPVLGAEHVVVGEARGTEGRRRFAATSLYDAQGSLMACAEQIWFTVEHDPSRG